MTDLVLAPARLDQLRSGAVGVLAQPALFHVSGAGALPCLQGLLTNDLQAPGDYALVYGAFLTPKGMITCDAWVLRLPGEFVLLAPEAGRAALVELFRRGLPPRLAKAVDYTGAWAALWLLGDAAPALLGRAGMPLPDDAGRAGSHSRAAGVLHAARGTATAPFRAVVTGPAAAVAELRDDLAAAGLAAGDVSDLDAARVLAGWPALGREIDEKTLVQEVRYDEIGGVSYTKGCYTGQETVARLHFRGHTNRELRGLAWEDAAPLTGTEILGEGKPVGTVRSTVVVGARRLGLAPVRREVPTGAVVEAGGRPARLVPLPFEADLLAG